jgi:hypothetical protein
MTAPAPASTLLLCIDLQPVFLAAMAESQRVHWRCSFALEAAAGLNLPVLFTEQVPAKLGHTAKDLLALCSHPEAHAKDAFSALGDEQIAARLKAAKPRELFICGIETPVCVYQTARDALQCPASRLRGNCAVRLRGRPTRQ